jgi:SulP family sulfate permease
MFLLNLFRKGSQKYNLKNEILSGLTVALALIPEAVAFSIIAGVPPLSGLYAAFTIGLIASIAGGRPGMISGATGAIAVVVAPLVAQHGFEYLLAAVVLMGFLQVITGVLRLGKFIRLVPHPVMFGFVNGLAIVIFMAQLEQFKTVAGEGTQEWLSGMPLFTMVGLVGLTMAIITLFPKLTKVIPSSLMAIIAVSLLVIGFDINTKSVGDIASIAGGLPEFHFPVVPFTLETLKIILPYSIVMAGVGLIESLLTLSLIDEITETRGRGNRECVGQGVANLVTGVFGGMGGCAMIGQSLINISSGGKNRISGVVAALALLTFILVGAPIIERLPMAALVGVMFIVAIGTFEWASLKVFGKVPLSDVIVMLIVTLVTVFLHNLALAVLIGVIISALVFAWENSKRIRARKYIDENGVKHYEIYGPLFFGSTTVFSEKFNPQEDPEEVIIDFAESRVIDHSAIEALNKLTERYLKAGKTLHLRHLSKDCLRLLHVSQEIIDVNIVEDPTYKIVSDELS